MQFIPKNSKSLECSLFSALIFLYVHSDRCVFFMCVWTWSARFHDICDIRHFRIRHNPGRIRLQSRSFRKRLTYEKEQRQRPHINRNEAFSSDGISVAKCSPELSIIPASSKCASNALIDVRNFVANPFFSGKTQSRPKC